jgi:Rieske Fe-S protein
MNDKMSNNRRDFLKKVGAVATMGVFASSFAAIINSCEQDEVKPAPDPETVDIDVSGISSAGAIAKFTATLKNGDKKNLAITRVDAVTFVVLDLHCPHQGCTVDIAAGGQDFNCPCHDVKFNSLTGAVTVKPIADSFPGLTKYKVFAFDAATNILKIIIS